MREISLITGGKSIVDPIDFEWLSSFTWFEDSFGYAYHRIKHYIIEGRHRNPCIPMHKAILGPRIGLEIDHINKNKLDNRRANLRFATRSENMMNRGKQVNNKSMFKGVYIRRDGKKWCAEIQSDGHQIYLGSFVDKVEAAKVYDYYARHLHGEFANLNFPEVE